LRFSAESCHFIRNLLGGGTSSVSVLKPAPHSLSPYSKILIMKKKIKKLEFFYYTCYNIIEEL
jgi:hypothetical protein